MSLSSHHEQLKRSLVKNESVKNCWNPFNCWWVLCLWTHVCSIHVESDLKFPPVCAVWAGLEDGVVSVWDCVCVCIVGEFGVALGWETGFILFALAADQDDPNHPLLFLSFFHFVSATFCFHYSFYCLPPSLCLCPVVLLLFHFAAVSLRLIISLSPSL